MSKLYSRCPRCDALVIGGMRYCGKCGWDMSEPYWKETTEGASSAESVKPTETARTEAPKPVETARMVTASDGGQAAKPSGGEKPAPPSGSGQAAKPADSGPAAKPSGGGHIRFAEYEGYEEKKNPLDAAIAFFRSLSRTDLIKLCAAAAAALVIIITAIVLIVRMNRKPPEPEISEPLETMHIIEAPTYTPAPTPEPTNSPVPTQTPAAALPTATPGWEVSEVSGVIYAVTDNVKIYAGPGTDFEVIATVYRGDELTRTGVLDGWTRVDIDGREGYISHGDLSMTKPAPTPTPTPLEPDFEVEERDDTVTVDSGANLRLGPGTEYSVVDTAGGGAQLHRTGVVGAWSQVEYDGYRVYVYTELLRGEETPTPAPDATATPAPTPTDAPAPVEPDSGSESGTITMYQNGHVRSGPGTEYDSLGIAAGGSKLESSGRTGDWYIVTFNGQTGYVYAGLVE